MNGQIPNNLSRTGYDINAISSVFMNELAKMQSRSNFHNQFVLELSYNNWNNNPFQMHMKTLIDMVDWHATNRTSQSPVETAATDYAEMAAAVWMVENNLLQQVDQQTHQYINQMINLYNQMLSVIYGDQPKQPYNRGNNGYSPQYPNHNPYMQQQGFNNRYPDQGNMGYQQPRYNNTPYQGNQNNMGYQNRYNTRQPMYQSSGQNWNTQGQFQPVNRQQNAGFYNQSVDLNRNNHFRPSAEPDPMRGDLRQLKNTIEQQNNQPVQPEKPVTQFNQSNSKVMKMDEFVVESPKQEEEKRVYITTYEQLKEVENQYRYAEPYRARLFIPPALRRLRLWVENNEIQQQVLELSDMNEVDHLTVLAPYKSKGTIASKAAHNPYSTKTKSGFEYDVDNTFQAHFSEIISQMVADGKIKQGASFVDLDKSIQNEICLIAAKKIRDKMMAEAKDEPEEIVEHDDVVYGTDALSTIADVKDGLFVSLGQPTSFTANSIALNNLYKSFDTDEIVALKTLLKPFTEGSRDINPMIKVMQSKSLPGEIWGYIEHHATEAVNKGLSTILNKIASIDSFTDDMGDLIEYLTEQLSESKITKDDFARFLMYVILEISVFSQPTVDELSQYERGMSPEEIISLSECSIYTRRQERIFSLERTAADLGFSGEFGCVHPEGQKELYQTLSRLVTSSSLKMRVVVTSDMQAYRIYNMSSSDRTNTQLYVFPL